MQRLPWSTLALVAVVCAVGGYVLTSTFYARLPPLGWGWVTLLLVAAVDVVLALRVRAAVEKGRVGQDRSQMHPLAIARALAFGQASAVLGAVAGGGGVGVTVFLAVRSADLVAARSDLPSAIGALVAGVVVTAAGVFLERSCELPPPEDDAEVLAQPG